MFNWNFDTVQAYAAGYYDGRECGEEKNLYATDELRHAYRLGYDRGVSDFCAEE